MGDSRNSKRWKRSSEEETQAMEEGKRTGKRDREGVRWIIRERIMEELQERHHMDDGELLLSLIHI